MSRTIYYTRKRRVEYIRTQLLNHFDFKLCYENRNENIYKNKDMMVTCKKKYVSVCFFDDENTIIQKELKKLFTEKQ